MDNKKQQESEVMVEEKATNNRNNNIALWLIIAAIILAIAAFLAWFFTNGTETRSSNGGSVEDSSSVVCKATDPEDAFFDSSEAKEIKHEISMTIRGDKLDDLLYVYGGVYDSEKDAENARATLHKDYNIYMSEHGVDAEKYNPVFNYVGTEVTVSLYVERGKLVMGAAPVFFLTGEEFGSINNGKNSADDLKKIYESKGFTCDYNE